MFRIIFSVLCIIIYTITKVATNDSVNNATQAPTTPKPATTIVDNHDNVTTENVFHDNQTEPTEIGSGVWKSKNYPNPYPKGNYLYEAHAKEGCQIELTIEKFDVDGFSNDYLIVKPGIDINTKDKGLIFTWKVNKKKYVIDNNYAVAEFVANTNINNSHTGFLIKWRQFEPEYTTAPPTTTTEFFPTPKIITDAFYIVYILVPSVSNFLENKNKFVNMLVNMSIEYCNKSGIYLAENITTENINISIATQCNYLWPDSKKCVEIEFAIPVKLKDDKKSHYGLNKNQLQNMWDEYSKIYLSKLKWTNFKTPDTTSVFFVWLGISIAIIIIFFVFLFILRHYSYIFNDQSFKQKFGENEQIITPRQSDTVLWPMSNQIVPPIFGNDNIYSYYEPDMHSNIPFPRTFSGNHNHGADLDDSDVDILDVTNIQIDEKKQRFITLANSSENNETTF